jgi:hypothetical protein
MFLSILERKLGYHHRKLNKIDTWNAKASQYNHHSGEYKKKKLSERWNIINDIRVQRDMYSAFLIMNTNEDLKSFNQEKIAATYENFLYLHNLEVKRLLGKKNLSSIAI